MKYIKLLFPLTLLALFTSCETDTYETGDGKYSYLHADFGEVKTGTATEVVGCVTDDGVSLSFKPHYTAKWAAKADTTYRALIYYNKVENGVTDVYALSQVPVAKALVTERPDTVKTDPLTLESAWVSAGYKYLNVGFAVKTGVADGIDARQTIGVIQDSLVTKDDGTTELYLRLAHAQNGVPEYYTAHGFLSIPLPQQAFLKVHLSVRTYQGEVTKEF